MRILEVVHGFPPATQGGTELYARAHARALREDGGNEIVVLTREQALSRAEYDVRTEERDRLRIVWVNNTFRNTRTFEETYRNDAIGAIASRLIDDFKPNVAHIHHLTGLSTTIVRSLADRHIPCFFTLHDYWLLCHRGQLLDVNDRVCDGPPCHACLGPAAGAGPVGFLGAVALRRLEKHLPQAPARELRRVAQRVAAMASSADEAEDQESRRIEHMRLVCADITHFLAPSQCIRDRFVQFGVAPEKITVTANGVDHRSFATRLKPDPTGGESTWGPPSGGPMRHDRLHLGFLGTLMLSKAPHVLLEAVSHLPSGSVSVDLFGAHASYHGDDSYRQRLEAWLGRDGVRAHGAIPHDQIAQALASIDVLVVPSIWPENAPLVIQEAFLAGVPVVASRIGGIPEMVTDGRNGLLFQAGDAEDLARTLARLLYEPGLLESLRARIPPVRSIEEDVRFARSLYQQHQPHPSTGSRDAVDVKRIAAVVLNFRTPDETLLAVKSLLASRRPIDDLIVVNNDSRDSRDSRDSGDASDDTRAALKDVWRTISYIHTGSNLGFSGGMNVGIREALARGADRVLLVNSDVIVPPDAVERLEQCLDAAPHTGIAGPVVLARSEPDRIASLGMSYAPSTGRMRHRGTGMRIAAPEPPARVVDGVSGCLMLVRREVFEAVGLLDEDYFFSFEDLDFCLKARRAGYATVLAGRATAYHEGGQSLGAASPRRFYFAARNHLLLARRAEPAAGRFKSFCRACSIFLLNLAHALVSRGGSLPARLNAVTQGTCDYLVGRFGAGS